MNLEVPFNEQSFVVFDLETTGLDVAKGETICEIAAYKIKDKKVIDTFHSLVNPQKPIPPEAYKIHRIADSDVKDAPLFSELAAKLIEFFQDTILCAYNVRFDLSFFNSAMEKNGYPQLENPAVDIFAMAKKTILIPKYGLSEIAQFLQVDSQGRFHRAQEDARVAKEVFLKLAEILEEKGISRVSDYFTLYGFKNEIFIQQQKLKTDLVEGAINSLKKLKVRYFSSGNVLSEKIIQPIALLEENKNLYVLCRKHKEENFRLLVSRILKLEVV